jgi:hypothetical protein
MNEQEIAKEIAKKYGLKFLSESYRDNKEVIIEALMQDASDFAYLRKDLKDDWEILLTALRSSNDRNKKSFFSIGEHSRDERFFKNLYVLSYLEHNSKYLDADSITKFCCTESLLEVFLHLPRCVIDTLKYEKAIFDNPLMKIRYSKTREDVLKLKNKIWCDRFKERRYWRENYQEYMSPDIETYCSIFSDDRDVAEVLVLGAGSWISHFSSEISSDPEIYALASYEYEDLIHKIDVEDRGRIYQTENWRFFNNKEIYLKNLDQWLKIEFSSKDLYLIQSKNIGSIKIGIAQDCNARLKQLQTANPYELKLVHVFKGMGNLEKYLHKELDAFKLQGEWFSFDCKEHLPKVLLNLIPENQWCIL